MASVAELVLLLKSDPSEVEAGLGSARGMIGGLVDSLGKLGLAGMGVGVIKDAVGGVVGSFGDLIGAAEGLGDAQARVGLVFGDTLAAIVDENAQVANSLGLTKTAYEDQVGALGQLATSLGVSRDAALDMGIGITELAPKLAAYAGVEGQVASDALEKALLGKTKGLAALGIAITDADKAQAALSLGIRGEAKDWTEAQVAQVNYAAVMAKTGAAQAAWADNAGDVEVSMQRISSALEDAKVSIGEKLLPVVAPLVEQFANFLPSAIDTAMSVLGPFLDRMGEIASVLGSVLGPAIDIFKTQLAGGFIEGAEPVSVLRDLLVDTLGPAGEALFNAATAAGQFGSALSLLFGGDASGGFERLGQSVWNALDAIGALTGLDLSGITEFLFGTDEDAGGAWDSLGVAIHGIVEAASSLLDTISPWLPTFTELIGLVAGLAAGFAAFSIITTVIGWVTSAVAAFGAISGAITTAGGVGAALVAFLGGPLTIVIGAIAGLVALLAAAWINNWFGIREVVASVVDWFESNVWPILQQGAELLMQAFDALAAVVGQVWRDQIQPAIGEFIAWFQSSVLPILQAVVSRIAEIMGGIVTFIRENWDSISLYVGGALNVIIGVIQVALNYIVGVWRVTIALLRGDWSGAWAAIQDTVAGVTAGVRRILDGLISFLRGLVSLTINAAREIGLGIVSGIRGALEGAWDSLVGKLRSLVNLLPQVVIDMLGIHSPSTVFWEIARMIVAGLTGGIDENASAAIEAMSKLVSSIKSIADNLLGIFRTLSDADVPGSFEPLLTTLRAYADQAGALLGIVAGVGAGIDEDQAKRIESGSKALSSMAGAVKAVVDAVSLLGVRETTTTGGRSIITERLTTLLPDEGTIDRALAVLRKLATAAQQLAADFGPGIQFVGFDLFASAIDSMAKALKASADLKIGEVAIIDQGALDALGVTIERVRLKFASLAGEFIGLDEDVQELVASGLKRYQDAVGAMFSMLKSALDLSRQHQDVAVIDEGVLATLGVSIERVRLFFAGLAQAFIELPDAVQTLISGGMKRYQESIGAMFSVLSDVLAASRPVEDLALIDDGLLAQVGPSIERVRLFFADLAREFIETSEGVQTMISGGLKRYQETVGAAVGILSDVLGLELPETLDFESIDDSLLGRVGAFAERARLAAEVAAAAFLALSSGAQDRLSSSIKAWADSAGASLKLLSDVLRLTRPETLDFEGIDSGLVTRLVAFAGLALVRVQQASAAFELLTTETRDRLTASVKAWTDSAGAAVKLLGDVLGLKRGETLDFEGIDANLVTRLVAFAGLALARVRQAAAGFELLDSETRDRLTASIKAWTDSAGAAVKLIGDVLKSDFSTAADFAGIANLPQIVAAAKAALDEVARVAQGGLDTEGITKWVGAASAAVGLVSDTASALEDIADIPTVGDLTGRLSQIEAVIRLSFDALGRILTDIPIETANLRAAMATASGTAVQGLADVADGIGQIMELASGGLFGADPGRADLGFTQRTRGRRADFLASVLKDTIVRAVKAIQDVLGGLDIKPDDPKVKALGQLGDAFSKLADALTDLATAKIPDARQLAAVMAATTAVAGAVSLAPAGAGGAPPAGSTGSPGGTRIAGDTINLYGNLVVVAETDDPKGLVEALKVALT